MINTTTYTTCATCGAQYGASAIHACPTLRIELAAYPGLAWLVPNGTPLATLNQVAGEFVHWTATEIMAKRRSA